MAAFVLLGKPSPFRFAQGIGAATGFGTPRKIRRWPPRAPNLD